MNTGKILVIGGGLWLAYYLLKKKQAIENLHFSIDSVKLLGKELNNPNIAVGVRIRNLVNEDIDVNSIVGTLQLNGQVLGDAMAAISKTIPALSEQVVPVNVRLYNSGLIGIITQFIDGATGPTANFTFDGKVNYKGVNFPLLLNYKLI